MLVNSTLSTAHSNEQGPFTGNLGKLIEVEPYFRKFLKPTHIVVIVVFATMVLTSFAFGIALFNNIKRFNLANNLEMPRPLTCGAAEINEREHDMYSVLEATNGIHCTCICTV